MRQNHNSEYFRHDSHVMSHTAVVDIFCHVCFTDVIGGLSVITYYQLIFMYELSIVFVLKA